MKPPTTITAACPRCGHDVTINVSVQSPPALRVPDSNRSATVVVTVDPSPNGHTCPPDGEQVAA
jgi:hypothetical protein